MIFRNALAAFEKVFPVALGYIPVGFAYGVLALQAGLSPANTLWMSIIVYAGSSQLIAVGLLSLGSSPLSLILTTFIVNLRHMLMSASLSPFLKNWKKIELAGFAFELTDETFALHSMRFNAGQVGKTETILINIMAQFSWVFGTWLGVTAGQIVNDVQPYALDYALPAMFIALLVIQIKDRTQLVVAIVGGVFSVALFMVGITQWNVILATILAATLGVFGKQWIKRPSS
jgi:4-azaleucine resistance transporter AzlC